MVNFLKSIRSKIFGIGYLSHLIKREAKNQNYKTDFWGKELKAMELIKPYMPKEYFPITGFSMRFQSIQHILNDVIIFKPKVVLEIGSGISTVVLCNFFSAHKLNTVIYSIDNDEKWQKLIENATGNSSNLKAFTFPLRKNPETGEVWYDIEKESLIMTLSEIDMILIDGPKGSLSSKARHGILKLIDSRFKENQIIFIDDTNRPSETELVNFLVKKHKFFAHKQARHTRLIKAEREPQLFTNP